MERYSKIFIMGLPPRRPSRRFRSLLSLPRSLFTALGPIVTPPCSNYPALSLAFVFYIRLLHFFLSFVFVCIVIVFVGFFVLAVSLLYWLDLLDSCLIPCLDLLFLPVLCEFLRYLLGIMGTWSAQSNDFCGCHNVDFVLFVSVLEEIDEPPIASNC